MKKLFLGLFIFLGFAAQSSFAQMDDGNYKFSSKEVTVEMEVVDNGWKIRAVKVTNHVTGNIQSGTGYYRTKNGYGWYEFQTNLCNYSFSVPSKKTLTLEKFDCENGIKSKNYPLKQQ